LLGGLVRSFYVDVGVMVVVFGWVGLCSFGLLCLVCFWFYCWF